MRLQILCQVTILALSMLYLTGCDSLVVNQDTGSAPGITGMHTSDATVITPSPSISILPTDITQSSVPKAIIVARETKEEQESPKYAMIMSYPFLEGDSTTNTLNEAVSAYLDQQKSDFLESVNDNEEWRSQNMPQVGNTMQIAYVITYQSSSFISILFTNDIYLVGAAHPNMWVTSLNYDLTGNGMLSLSDIFSPSAAYLETISDYCIGELMEQEILQMPDGALPEEENYTRWNITGQGIQITFDPYQVAPYAAGTPQVLVPYEVLRPMIDAGSPLWEIIQS